MDPGWAAWCGARNIGGGNVPKAEVSQDSLMMKASLKDRRCTEQGNGHGMPPLPGKAARSFVGIFSPNFTKTHGVGVVTFPYIWGNLASQRSAGLPQAPPASMWLSQDPKPGLRGSRAHDLGTRCSVPRMAWLSMALGLSWREGGGNVYFTGWDGEIFICLKKHV